MNRQEIYKALDGERDYQNKRWGDQHDRAHEVEAFMIYMEDYLQEAKHKVSRESGVQGGLDTLRKVVALGVACFEVHGVPQREVIQ